VELDRSRTGRRNLLLASLPAKDFALLAPQLKDIVLEQGAVLQEQGERIDQVYFPHDGIVSLLAVMRQGDAIETATIGYEGAVGSFAGLGMRRAHTRAVVQVRGSASRIAASRFRKVAEESEAVCRIVVRYGEMLLIQVQQTAACNALHPVEGRLSRWLLQTRDRIESNTIKLTQEFLSQMLGVRRTTVVANMLQQADLIRYHRGQIEIVDRLGSRRESANATRPFGGISKKSRRRREGRSGRRRLLNCNCSLRRIGNAASVRYPRGARRYEPVPWRPAFRAAAQEPGWPRNRTARFV
jgi:CRP-like cAMP-binding protein